MTNAKILRILVSQRDKAMDPETLVSGVWSLEPKLKLRNGASGEHGRSQFTPRITSVAVEAVIVCLCQQRDTEEKMKPVILARCNLIN